VIVRLTAVLLTTFVCVGCVPFPAYDLPAVNGVIRDTATKQPIGAAKVLVASKSKADVQESVVSDSFGRFSAAAKTHTVWLLPLPFDPAVPDCTVRISAPGYEDQLFDLYEIWDQQRGHIGPDGPEFNLRHS